MKKQKIIVVVNQDDIIDGRVKMVSSDRLEPGRVWILDSELFDWATRLPTHEIEKMNFMNFANPQAIRLYLRQGKEEKNDAKTEEMGTHENKRTGNRDAIPGHESPCQRNPDSQD